MLLLAVLSAAIATQPHASHPVTASAQATATIRIVTAVRLKLDGSENRDAPPVRNVVLRTSDGVTHPAKLIEFQ
jgi:hypothetical protein